MKGLIYDIKRFALHDGPGIRTTVFFKGCPLDCWWCHNPESKNPFIEKSTKTNLLDGQEFEVDEETGYEISPRELIAEIYRDKAFMDESGGGVTFSGGEPLLQPDFLIEMFHRCKNENIHSALDTSGYADEEVFREVALLADLILYDLKHLDDEKHIKYTGISNQKILKNLDFLHHNRAKVIIRFPLIPGINDGEHISILIENMQKRYPEFKEIHLLPYHNIGSHKYERFGIENRLGSLSSLQESALDPVVKLLNNEGFNVMVGG